MTWHGRASDYVGPIAVVVGLILPGCPGGITLDPNAVDEYVVDCLGMIPDQVSGPPEGMTRLPVTGDLDVINGLGFQIKAIDRLTEGNRCGFRFNSKFDGSLPTVGLDAYFEDTVNSGFLAVNLGGEAYYITEDGDITFDEGSTRAAASGTYDGMFTPASGQGDEVHVKGRFEYCHMPSEVDCPYKIQGVLDYPMTIRAPKFGQDVSAEAIECRAIIDRPTGALQLDLQIGIWRGLNLSHLFDNCVGIPPVSTTAQFHDNRLRFRVGGVTGPGTYGPYLAQTWLTDSGDVTIMPELEWKPSPAFAFLYTANAVNAGVCMLIGQGLGQTDEFPSANSYIRTVPDQSECTLTIADTEDQVHLSCTDIEAFVPNTPPPLFETGNFELDTACRISYRD